MKHAILKFLTVVTLLTCLTGHAQFRRTSDGSIYPYTNTLKNSDVFVIGVVGVTNKNFAASNMLSAIGGTTKSNNFVGSFTGLIVTGSATNSAGSRVAYLSDTNGGSGTAYTNNTDLPGKITGSGIGSNTTTLALTASLGTAAYSNSASFQNASLILSNVVSGASNNYIGAFTGLISTGNATNGSGIRVAYLSDTNGLGGGGSSTASTNEVFSYVLSNAVAVSGTNVSLDRTFAPPATIAGHIAIGFGTTNCEIRPARTVSGNVVSFTRALTFSHAVNDRVVWFDGDAYCSFWGMKADMSSGGNGTDNGLSMVNALWDTSQEGLRLRGNGSFGVSHPLVIGVSGQLADITLGALNTVYTANLNTNSWFMLNQQGSRYAIQVFGSNTITFPGGTWTPPAGNNASNSIVVFYGVGGTNLPTGLTNGIPYYVKAWSTSWMRVGLTEGSASELTLGTGTGYGYTECASMSKIYLDNVTLDALNAANCNGLLVTVQQPAQIRYLRLNRFNGTAMRTLQSQQIDINNLEIIECGLGLDFRGSSFIYIKALNVEQFTNVMWGGAHIWGMHVETCLSTNGVGIDLTKEDGSDLMIDGFSSSVAIGTAGVLAFTNFILSTATTDTHNAVDLRRLSFPNGGVNDGLIAISDPLYGQNIHVWNDLNGRSCNRYLPKYQRGTYPTADVYLGEYGGFVWPTLYGGEVRFGMQYGNFPRMNLRASTNQTAATLQVVKSDGTLGKGFNAAGELIPPAVIAWASSTNGITLSYPYTASSYVMTSDASVTGIIGNVDGYPSSSTFSLTNSTGSNCTLRASGGFISYGPSITNNALVIPAGKKAKVAFDFERGTNWAGGLQP